MAAAAFDSVSEILLSAGAALSASWDPREGRPSRLFLAEAVLGAAGALARSVPRVDSALGALLLGQILGRRAQLRWAKEFARRVLSGGAILGPSLGADGLESLCASAVNHFATLAWLVLRFAPALRAPGGAWSPPPPGAADGAQRDTDDDSGGGGAGGSSTAAEMLRRLSFLVDPSKGYAQLALGHRSAPPHAPGPGGAAADADAQTAGTKDGPVVRAQLRLLARAFACPESPFTCAPTSDFYIHFHFLAFVRCVPHPAPLPSTPPPGL